MGKPPLAASQGLNEKEVALAQKEAELKRMEVELRAAGGGQKRKNWPPLCPCMHHDIAGEVPAEARGAVRAAYAAYLVGAAAAACGLQ